MLHFTFVLMLRTFTITLITLTLAITSFGQDKLTQADYIELYYKLAVEEMERSGIPASITLAQGIIESGSGNSQLAKVAKNHFGIKCHKDWTGEGYYMDDDAPDECFRVYDSPEQSFIDHSDFIRGRPWYKSLFDLEVTDYKGWAKGLKKAGYATNPKYADLLIGLIEKHELSQYDVMSSTAWRIAENTQPVTKEQMDTIPGYSANLIPQNYAGEVITVNGKNAVIAREGETALAIALSQDIDLGKLYSVNDLALDAPIRPGDIIFLEKKKKKGPVKLYVVQKAETMHQISQKFGIRLQKLYDRNRMMVPDQVVPGETIYLQGMNPGTPATRTLKEVIEEQMELDESYKYGIARSINVQQATEAVITEDEVIESPEPATSKFHTVITGDTLYSISLKYNATIDEIKEWNNLSSNTIKLGQVLQVAK